MGNVGASGSELMDAAITAAETGRTATAPDPWVGAALRTLDGSVFTASTGAPGGSPPESALLAAVRRAGADPRGATVAITLEPCDLASRTGSRADALVAAGVACVLIGIEDPDPRLAGSGAVRLRDGGVAVETGVSAERVSAQLRPYLHHRRTGRPWVVLKTVATVDGRTAAPDGSSQWISGEHARRDSHRLRAESQAILVGAATVRTDDPSLTVRLVEGPDPRRVVLGHAPEHANVRPCLEWTGPLEPLLDRLGGEGVVQLLVEGGAAVAAQFHAAGLVDQYVVYLAPAVFGGEDARPLFTGPAAPTLAEMTRLRFAAVTPVGEDLRLDLVRPDVD